MGKLKEKFKYEIQGTITHSKELEETAASCAEITKDTAIKFAQWINEKDFDKDSNDGWFQWIENTEMKKTFYKSTIRYTAEELFNLFIETI